MDDNKLRADDTCRFPICDKSYKPYSFLQQQYAEQMATGMLYDLEWDDIYLDFLTDVFHQNTYGSTVRAIYHAVAHGRSAHEIFTAYQIKILWQENPYFHLSVDTVRDLQTGRQNNWISWGFAFKLLDCFSGIPCMEEIYFHLENLLEHWELYSQIRVDYPDFLNFVSAQFGKPVVFWLPYVLPYQDEVNFTFDSVPVIDVETNIPNAWYKAQCLFYGDAHNAYAYLSDTELYGYPKENIWHKHQEIIRSGVLIGMKPYEIMKQIPLNHPRWSEEIMNLFDLNGIVNLYQSIGFVFRIHDIELRQYAVMLIREYIEEIKSVDALG